MNHGTTVNIGTRSPFGNTCMRRIATLIAPLSTIQLGAPPLAAAGVGPQQIAEARSEAPSIHSSADLADYLRRHPDNTRFAAFSPGAHTRFIDQLNFRDGHLASFSTEDLGELTRSQGNAPLRLLRTGDLVDHIAIPRGSLDCQQTLSGKRDRPGPQRTDQIRLGNRQEHAVWRPTDTSLSGHADPTRACLPARHPRPAPADPRSTVGVGEHTQFNCTESDDDRPRQARYR